MLAKHSFNDPGVLTPYRTFSRDNSMIQSVFAHGLSGTRHDAFIQKPPNDKIYYPVYVKAIELGLPITINVGLPGPRVPGAC